MAPKNLKYASLCDIYGGLLSDKQRSAVEMYYCDDLSLAEIAEHMGITRQGVRDQIKHAEEELDKLEYKLALLKKEALISELVNIFESLELVLDEQKIDFEKIKGLCSEGRSISEALIGDFSESDE